MRILFALNSYFPHARAGTEMYVKNLASHLTERGHVVVIAIPSVGVPPKTYLYEGLTIRQFEISAKPNAKELNGLEPPSGQNNLLQLVEDLSPDIVHIHTLGRAFNGLTVRALKQMNVTTIVTPHLSDMFCVRGDLQLFSREVCDGQVQLQRCMECYLEKRNVSPAVGTIFSSVNQIMQKVTFFGKNLPPAWRLVHHRQEELSRIGEHAKAVIAIAPWIARVLECNGLKNVRMIKQGLTSAFEQALTKVTRKLGTPVTVGFAGRIYPDKGLHLLLSSAEKLAGKNIRFHIVGIKTDMAPKYFDEIYDRACKLPNIVWEENLTSTDLRVRMLNWNVLCLPSTGGEMAPLVILEAAACGVPTVGSSYPAIADMINDDIDGLIFETGNYESLTAQLNRLIQDPSLISRLAKSLKRPRTFSDVANETIELYHSVSS